MDLNDSKYYINRELSWLEFNARVLEEAQDKANPLFERLKFLAITASNLDEFFMIRVSSLIGKADATYKGKDFSGLSAAEQLKAISKRVHVLVNSQYNCLNRSIIPALEKENIYFAEFEDLNESQKEFIRQYFYSTIFPILTPMAIDQSRPFPLLNNKAIVFLVELSDKKENRYFATLQVPTVIKRLVLLPSNNSSKQQFIFLETIIKKFMNELFTGHKVVKSALFRITRNSDLEIDEEDAPDLLDEIEKSVKLRKWGKPVRLEIEKNMGKFSGKYLKSQLDVADDDVYEISGLLDTTVFFQLAGLSGYDHLKNETLKPIQKKEFYNKNIFEAIREKDIIVHHPYDSFDCVIDFVNTAAADPDVLAIKQTLYRVSGNSPIIRALMQAAENGKQVTVIVELKARFDEENNINWARQLERSGCHVVYGLVGLKTHCKACLIIRKEEEGIRRYVHLGTGNYNDSTAKIYTDVGFFTCKESFGKDISSLFNSLTGYSNIDSWNKITVAPLGLRDMFLREIDAEIKNLKEGKKAKIIAKMNSLVDMDIIKALYTASIAGVEIKLIVRGICCLRAGVNDISENITVVSIVDRFLEHSRIYYFENDGYPKIYLSSADWMPRNLDRRVELAFPVEEEELKKELIEIMELTLADTVKLRIQQKDGSYERVDRRGKELLHSQLEFYEQAKEKAKKDIAPVQTDRFIPILATPNEENVTEG